MKRLWTVLTILLVIGVVAYTWVAPYGGEREEALDALSKDIPASAQHVFKAAMTSHNDYRKNAGRWSFAFFGCTFGAALLSALAAIILKLDSLAQKDALRKDLAAGCAGVASLLITLATIGNFEGKWRANRLAASGVESAIYRLADPSADVASIRAELREIHAAQDRAIVASRGSAAP